MKMSFKKWVGSVLGRSIDMNGVYGCQSPDIVLNYAQQVFGEDNAFTGNAFELKPGSKSWKSVIEIRPGDVAVFGQNPQQPYGDCLVVTKIEKNKIYGVGSLNNIATIYGYPKERLISAYRFAPTPKLDTNRLLEELLRQLQVDVMEIVGDEFAPKQEGGSPERQRLLGLIGETYHAKAKATKKLSQLFLTEVLDLIKEVQVLRSPTVNVHKLKLTAQERYGGKDAVL